MVNTPAIFQMEMVIFDLAGTTVNEQNVVYKTVHKAIERGGFSTNLDFVLLHAAGKEKYRAICDVLEQLLCKPAEDKLAQDIYKDFEELLVQAYHQLDPVRMPGADDLFALLRERGIKVVLNTGYKRDVAMYLMNRLDWVERKDYDLLITASEVKRGRPHPDMILLAMEQFGIVNAHKVAKIGDSIADIEEGFKAGCGLVAGITTGAQTREQLATAKPTHIFDHLSDMVKAL